MCNSDETSLVVEAREGNPAAFDRLARIYRPAGLMLAHRVLRCREAAEDTVQDALLTAFKALPQLSDPSRFAAWFATIVRHKATRRLKRPERVEESFRSHLDDLILREAPSIVVRIQFESSDVLEQVSSLPTDLAEAATLYYVDGYTVGQVGQLLAVPTTTVKWRLHEARRKLRGKLSLSTEE